MSGGSHGGGGHGGNGQGGGDGGALQKFAGIAIMAVLAVLSIKGASWWSSGSSSSSNDQPTITIASETLLLSRRADGGLETEPFFVGTRRVAIPISNNQCIHTARNGNKVELVGTDGAFDNSFEAYYKSKGKKSVKITIVYYPRSSEFCAHLNKVRTKTAIE